MPRRFSAGDTIKLQVSDPAYTVSDWSLSFSLLGPSSLIIEATEDDDVFSVTLSSTQTAELKPGQYLWAYRLTDGSNESFTYRTGAVEIGPNIFVAPAPTPTATLVANLEAAVNTLSTKTRDNVTVNGLTYGLVDIEKLYNMLRNARADLKAEQDAMARASGLNRNNLIKLRFGRP